MNTVCCWESEKYNENVAQKPTIRVLQGLSIISGVALLIILSLTLRGNSIPHSIERYGALGCAGAMLLCTGIEQVLKEQNKKEQEWAPLFIKLLPLIAIVSLSLIAVLALAQQKVLLSTKMAATIQVPLLLVYVLLYKWAHTCCCANPTIPQSPKSKPIAASSQQEPIPTSPRGELENKEELEDALPPPGQQPLHLPVVNPKAMPAHFFVDVINAQGYRKADTDIRFPPASAPRLIKNTFQKQEGEGKKPPLSSQLKRHFEGRLANCKRALKVPKKEVLRTAFVDQTTEMAIAAENGHYKLALNFANQNHAGGGPGIHKDPKTEKIVYQCGSAKAQEESMGQRSNLLESLFQLTHKLIQDGQGMWRSWFCLDPTKPKKQQSFDSKKEAYVSNNHLFAIQKGPLLKDFYLSTYLDRPQPVTFITSAAEYYGDKDTITCIKNSAVYNDAYARITTHLLAAAQIAFEAKMKNPQQQPIELILGAFGCGAFAPKGNPDEYRSMIAGIYAELVPELTEIIDLVTYAVPTFNEQKNHPAVKNHVIFKQILRL